MAYNTVAPHVSSFAPRDYGQDFNEAVKAALEPLQTAIQFGAQQTNATHVSNEDLNASLDSALKQQYYNRSLAIEQRRLGLENARAEHYLRSDDIRLAAEQARAKREATQDAAEQLLVPLKKELIQQQVVDMQTKLDQQKDLISKQTEDAANLNAFRKEYDGLTQDDLLNGAGESILSKYNFNTIEASQKAVNIMQHRTGWATLEDQRKQMGNWGSKAHDAYSQMLKDGIHPTDAFPKAKDINDQYLLSQKVQEKQQEQRDKDWDPATVRESMFTHFGLNPKDTQPYGDPSKDPTAQAAARASQYTDYLIQQHRNDPDRAEYLRDHPEQIESILNPKKPTDFLTTDNTKTQVTPSNWLKQATPGTPSTPSATPTPSAVNIEPSGAGNPVPLTDPREQKKQQISNTFQTLLPETWNKEGSLPRNTDPSELPPLSQNDHLRNTLGAIRDWHADTLASIQDAQNPTA